jgi:hypothetical protein
MLTSSKFLVNLYSKNNRGGIMNRLENLYKEAIEIEAHSQSPRIQKLHKNGQQCEVGVGITDPNLTQYLFVCLNPGGNPVSPAKRYTSMEQYLLAQEERLARKMKILIDAFALKKNISPPQNAYPMFGTTNISFFHSRTTRHLDESFCVEAYESLPVLKREISIPKLKALIFSGVTYEYFFYNLYKAGTQITDYFGKDSTPKIYSFKTQIVTGARVVCAFIRHLSGPPGLSDDAVKFFGRKLAELLIEL